MRTLKYIGAAAAVLLLAALALGIGLLRASLPPLEGASAEPGLTSVVRIARDSRGVPTIEVANRLDLAYATGFVHAQDRYFQMDLSRRLAAGELAELFGGVALEQDRKARLFRFRSVAREVIAQATSAERAVIDAYARGVNAGLADLAGRPWEYWLLGQPPLPWRPEDTILVEYAMWWDLQANGLRREILRQEINARLGGPECGARWKCGLGFLYPAGTSWDAPAAPASEGAVTAAPAVPPAGAGGGRQQVGGRGPPDYDGRRAHRQRYAPRAAGPAGLVSRTPQDPLQRRRSRTRPERRHAARSAAAGRRVERTHRLGLYQQLRHLAGRHQGAVHRGGAA